MEKTDPKYGLIVEGLKAGLPILMIAKRLKVGTAAIYEVRAAEGIVANRRVPDATKEAIAHMLRLGDPVAKIAKTLHVSYQTIRSVRDEEGIDPKAPGPRATLPPDAAKHFHALAFNRAVYSGCAICERAWMTRDTQAEWTLYQPPGAPAHEKIPVCPKCRQALELLNWERSPRSVTNLVALAGKYPYAPDGPVGTGLLAKDKDGQWTDVMELPGERYVIAETVSTQFSDVSAPLYHQVWTEIPKEACKNPQDVVDSGRGGET